MGDTRLTNFALGKYANFYSTSANVFAQNDTTPDVTNGVLFFSNNTTSTVITNFDLTGFGAGSQSQQFEGKLIKVVFLDVAQHRFLEPQQPLRVRRWDFWARRGGRGCRRA